MAIVDDWPASTVFAQVSSRNSATKARKSGTFIDFYRCKGQICVRALPMETYRDPTPKMQRTWDAAKFQAEQEKRFTAADVYAWKYRARNSMYTWWELYGKWLLSNEYHNPGTTRVPVLYRHLVYPGYGEYFFFRFNLPCRAYARCFRARPTFLPPEDEHAWREGPHCIGGMEFMLNTEEVFNPYTAREGSPTWGDDQSFFFPYYYIPLNTWFILETMDMAQTTIYGYSGMFQLRGVVPWYKGLEGSL